MKLGEENRRRRLFGRSKTPPLSAQSLPSADDSDSEGSIVRAPIKAHSSCGACRTRDTKQWWKAPKGLATPVLCDACGISWRKYADLNHLRPIREEAAAAKQGKTEKREGTPLAGSNSKRVKVSVSSSGVRMSVLSTEYLVPQTNGSISSTPPSTASNGTPQHRCLACHKYGSGKVFKCKECQTRVHSGEFQLSHSYILPYTYSSCLGACGIVDPGSIESWTCDLCQNEKTAEASLVRLHPVYYCYFHHQSPSFPRTLNACFVLEPSASANATKRHYTHLLIRSCVFANQLRVRVGYTSRVQCSYPR